jgi:hypothetical protein
LLESESHLFHSSGIIRTIREQMPCAMVWQRFVEYSSCLSRCLRK